MVVIRLARAGRKNLPFYSVVVADKRSPRDGRFIEKLGFYNPKDKDFSVNLEKVAYWLKVGAKASPTVGQLLKKGESRPNV